MPQRTKWFGKSFCKYNSKDLNMTPKPIHPKPIHRIALVVGAGAFLLAAPMAQAAADKFPEERGLIGGRLYIVDPPQDVKVTLIDWRPASGFARFRTGMFRRGNPPIRRPPSARFLFPPQAARWRWR
jgi:hypothetical protein